MTNDILRKRIFAFLIDLSVIYFFKFLSLMVYIKSIGIFVGALPLENKQKMFSNLHLLDNYLLIVLFTGYFVSCFYITNGKTLGKLLFNLELRGQKNEKILFDQYVLRTFAYLFCFLNGAFLLLIPLITKNGKGIPDWLSGTMVFKVVEIPVKKSDYIQNEAFDLKKSS